MKFVKKSFKFLVVVIAFLSITLPFSTTTFAEEVHSAVCNDLQHEEQHEEQHDESIVVARAAICPSCHEGYLLKYTHTSDPKLAGTSICSYRPDCMVTLYRTEYMVETSCTSCSFGYVEYPNPTYSSQHSIYHF